MAREFTAYVILRDPASKQSKTFAPGDEVPEWANVGDHVVATSEGVSQERQTPKEAPAGDDNTVANADGTETTIVTPEYEEEDETLPPYEEWSKTDLKAEAKGRELTGYSNATVDELVEMLKADDAAAEEE